MSEPAPEASRGGWMRHLPRLILALWALAITWLFLAPPAPGQPGHIQALAIPFLALFSGDSWNWGVGWSTWRDLLIGAGGLGAMALAGWLLLRCLVVFVPRGVAWAMALTLGLGVCGFFMTFLGILGVLYQWLAVVVFALLVAGLWVARRWAMGRVDLPESAVADLHGRGAALYSRNKVALDWERDSWLRPTGVFERILAGAMVTLIALITLLTFYHAVFFPVVYWDSMILYVGYARDMFLEHRFPIKVTAQVGVGLGANYAHLYELTGATIATWANHWSPLYQQLLAPLAGLATIVLVYHMALRQSRSVLVALAAALLVRAMPYVITYHIYASNYALVMLFSAAFLYAAMRYVEDGLPGYFALATLVAAFGMHVSYIMGTLWIAWVAMVIFAHWPRRRTMADEARDYVEAGHSAIDFNTHSDAPDFVRVEERPGLFGLFAKPWFWAWTVAGVAVGSVWYVRNWIVTGNPVYAFFHEIFGGKHINPEVMASASREWMSHGDGIGLMGPGLVRRILGSWAFFVTNPSTVWKWAPTFVGIVVPGVLVFLVVLACQSLFARPVSTDAKPVRVLDDSVRVGLVAFALLGILFFYHYVLSAYYLYHLLGAVVTFGIFIAFALRGAPAWMRRSVAMWAVWCGLVPGLAMAMMGMKLVDRSASELVPLHNPGMGDMRFYQLRYGQEPLMWQRINLVAKGDGILTHENRRLAFDPSVRLIHMDDWEVQQLWGKPERERLRGLEKLGVRWYLEVPYEFDHPINARLGHRAWIDEGILKPVYRVRNKDGRPVVLYRFDYPKEATQE